MAPRLAPLLPLLLLTAALPACTCSKDECIPDHHPGLGSQATKDAAGRTLSFEFTRVKESREFDVEIRLAQANGSPETGLSPSVEANHGRLDPATPVEGEPGHFRARVKPDDWFGEIDVTVKAGELQARRTALALAFVDEVWGEPRAVEGLVNTCAWEDGLHVSADGEWLFIQTLPVPIDCILRRAACDPIRGPMSAPQRPGFPGSERIDSDGDIRHTCPHSFGDTSLWPAIAVPPNTLFGFHRQADDSWGEPFNLSFKDSDGCFSPFGPSWWPDAEGSGGTMFMAWDSSTDAHPTNDLLAAHITLGAPVSFGTLGKDKDGPTETLATGVERIPLPNADFGEGNPHPLFTNGKVSGILFDDEGGTGHLFIQPHDPNADLQSGWQPKVELPERINTDGKLAMPFFDSPTSQLFYKSGDGIRAVVANGNQLEVGQTWGTPRRQLAPESEGLSFGKIHVLGEPTISRHGGKTQLHFIYGILRDDGTTDLNAGVVDAR